MLMNTFTKNQLNSTSQLLLIALTGELPVLSIKLKIKPNAVHVGLSQLLPQLKVLMPLKPENSTTYLNNNLLIVLPSGLDMAASDAMVV